MELNDVWFPMTIFIASFIPSLSPSLLLSSRKLRSMYNKASIVSAGLLLAILFIDFIPHLVGEHSHSHTHSQIQKEQTGAGQTHSHNSTHSHSHSHTENSQQHSHGHTGHSTGSHSQTGSTGSIGCTHEHHWYDDIQVSLITGGLTLIALIIIDQRVLKHSHCDNEEKKEAVKAEREQEHNGHNQKHSQEHTHGHSRHDGHSHSMNGHSTNEHSHSTNGHSTNGHSGHNSHSHSHNGHMHDHSTLSAPSAHGHNSHSVPSAAPSALSASAASAPGKSSADDIRGCCSEGLKYKTSIKQALIFIFIFSIHSIFEGFAFTPSQMSGSIGMALGLVVHKVLESITVGVALFSSKFDRKISVGLLLFYSLLTPLGIVLAGGISHVFGNSLVKSVFSGLSFGSLSFIVLVEMLPPIVHSLTNPIKIFYLFFGYLVGAVLISFAHCGGGCSSS